MYKPLQPIHITTTVTEEVAVQIDAAAVAQDMSRAAWVRKLILDALRRDDLLVDTRVLYRVGR